MTTSENTTPSLVLKGGDGSYYAIPLEVVQAHRVPDEQVSALPQSEESDVSGYAWGAQGSTVSGDFSGFDGGISAIIGLFSLPTNSFSPTFSNTHPMLDSDTTFNPNT